LLGRGGIGKSTIAVKAALQMQSAFEVVVWRSLANAPSLDELLTSLLKFLMPLQGDDPIIPATLDEKLVLIDAVFAIAQGLLRTPLVDAFRQSG
jgi:hypothetical protein